VGMFQVALLVIAGLLYGFGRSPYGHSLMVVPATCCMSGCW
jgi:hypothetical protein